MDTPEIQQMSVTKMQRIARLSRSCVDRNFDSLMHHYNQTELTDCFLRLNRKKAKGIDGVSKDEYGKNLASNIKTLIDKMKTMSYRPGAVREVLIPKGNGKFRPLGISNFEDKLVQMQTAKILNHIYDPIFYEDSYGFRPGRNCHQAIKALSQHLYKENIETVIDIDLENFFGTIDHDLLIDILQEKIKDKRFIRYIKRMLKAGVLSNGELTMSDEGTPQGSVCSPVLANIFAHYVIDTWIENVVKPRCRMGIKMFRYADDIVICCKSEHDALRIKQALNQRLNKYKLRMNEEKTKLVPFSKKKSKRGIKQGTFSFLGFEFYLGKSKRNFIIPKIKTNGKTLRNKLKRVAEWSRNIRNRKPLNYIWKIYISKLRGHVQYYGVSHNTKYVEIFMEKATRIVYKYLNRRSHKRSFNWESFREYIKRSPFPKATVIHNLFE